MKAFKATKISLAGTLDIEGAVSSITLGSTAAGSTITTFLAETLKIGGDSAGAVQLSGDLGFCTIARDLTGGQWDLAGGIRGLNARDAEASWIANVGGEAGNVRLRSLAGQINAGTIRSLVVSRDITHTTVHTALGGIDSLQARDLINTEVRSAEDIGKLTVRSATDSIIFAGVSDSVVKLPTASEAFASPARIGQVTVKTGPFANTLISASEIGATAIRNIQSDNVGVPFGIATTKLAAVVIPRVRRWKTGDDPAELQPIGDFQVNLLKPSASASPP
jgi:hypothetical protein